MRPAPPLLALLGLWALCGLATALELLPLWPWQALGAAIAVVAAFDAWRLWRSPTPQLRRELPEALPLGVEREAGLRIDSARRQTLDVFDLVPGGWWMQGLPRRMTLPAASETRLSYRLRPTARGRFDFPGTHLRLHSAWRL
ncbi:hypothetical protein XTGART10_0360 [Xanthomonas translucens pv. graminis]|nr:hypothetical protein XTGART9_0370 [Xanthomonas translucens pv. graminis]SBV53757.1 hypothetical protein XTGART10_0360 [Xanthomonas translucens pv. graminis]